MAFLARTILVVVRARAKLASAFFRFRLRMALMCNLARRIPDGHRSHIDLNLMFLKN